MSYEDLGLVGSVRVGINRDAGYVSLRVGCGSTSLALADVRALTELLHSALGDSPIAFHPGPAREALLQLTGICDLSVVEDPYVVEVCRQLELAIEACKPPGGGP